MTTCLYYYTECSMEHVPTFRALLYVTLTCYTSPYIQLSTTTSILMYVHGCNWKFYTTCFITFCNMRRKLGDRKLHKINTLQIFCLSDNLITSPYVIDDLHCMLQQCSFANFCQQSMSSVLPPQEIFKGKKSWWAKMTKHAIRIMTFMAFCYLSANMSQSHYQLTLQCHVYKHHTGVVGGTMK